MKLLVKFALLNLICVVYSCSNTPFTTTDSPAARTSANTTATNSAVGTWSTYLGSNDLKLTNLQSFDGLLLSLGSESLFPGQNLFESSDGGKTWKRSTIPDDLDALPGFQYIEAKNGNLWALAGKFLLKKGSTEETWKIIHQFPSFDSTHVSFWDEKLGYVVQTAESGCQILKTVDGGDTWSVVYKNVVSGNPFDLVVINSDTVLLAINNEYIIRTNDGGKTWKSTELAIGGLPIKDGEWVTLDRNGAAKILLGPRNVLWIAGEKGSFYYSDDAGDTWRRPSIVPSLDKGVSLNSIAFSPEGKAISVGDRGTIITSTDYGKTWQLIQEESVNSNKTANHIDFKHDNLTSVIFVDKIAVILGRNGLYSLTF